MSFMNGGRGPFLKPAIGERVRLVRATTIYLSESMDAREWVSIVGVLIAVHSGEDCVDLALDLDVDRSMVSIEIDLSEPPRKQRQEPCPALSGRAVAFVTDNQVHEQTFTVVLQLNCGAITLWLDENSFSEPVRERLALHLEILCRRSDMPVATIELPIVTSPQQRQVVPGSREARLEPEWDSCVIRRFLEVIHETPDSIALVAEGWALTYQELGSWVGGLADEFSCVAPTGTHIAILAEHGIEPVVGMLACLAAGMVYIPLDPRMPDGRLSRIVEQSGLTIIAHSTELAERAVGISPKTGRVALTLRSGNLIPPPESLDRNRPAYVLYTSGTTGTPKGVIQSAQAIVRHARNYRDSVGLAIGEVIPLLASFAFDAAVMDLYGGLLSGATVHVVDPMQPADSLREALGAWRPTVLHGTPTLLRHLLKDVNGPVEELGRVRVVVFGGERVQAVDVGRVQCAMPDAFVLNGFGPSECTVGVQHVISIAEPIYAADIPIGFAVPGVEVELVDSHGQPAPVVGELVLISDAVALGYQNEEERSALRFGLRNGRRSYHTGDRVWMHPDGSLVFLGRIDRQFKIRGQRIDPEEIESVLREYTDVDQAFVRLDVDGQLTATLKSSSAKSLDLDEILRFVRRTLPPVAVPSRLNVVKEMQIGYTGKASF